MRQWDYSMALGLGISLSNISLSDLITKQKIAFLLAGMNFKVANAVSCIEKFKSTCIKATL